MCLAEESAEAVHGRFRRQFLQFVQPRLEQTANTQTHQRIRQPTAFSQTDQRSHHLQQNHTQTPVKRNPI
jgi:hypothetical protein